MKVYRKIYAAQKAQRYLTVTVFAWLVSALEISPVGVRISALLAAAAIVLGIVSLSRSGVAKKDLLHETSDVHPEKTKRLLKILFPVCAVCAAVGASLCAGLCKKDFSSAYGTASYISNVLSPLLLMFVPAYIKAAEKAAEESSVSVPPDSAEPKRMILRGGNVCLLVLAFLASYAMLFYVSPMLYKGSEQYIRAQNDFRSNDISAAVQYKSATLADCDIKSVLENLPNGATHPTFSKGTDTLEIVYPDEADEKTKHAEIVYNATALFALADDLRRVDFTFGDEKTTVFRADAIGCYDNFPQILNNWQVTVSYELKDGAAVEKRFGRMAKEIKK